MSIQASDACVVSAIEEILDSATKTFTIEQEIPNTDYRNGTIDVTSNKNNCGASTGNHFLLNTDSRSKFEEDSLNSEVMKEDIDCDKERTHIEKEDTQKEWSPLKEVNSQFIEVNTKEEFIQAIELSPTPCVIKSSDSEVKLSQHSLHIEERKEIVHFSSPIASYHEYYVSQNTCESTQSLSNLTPEDSNSATESDVKNQSVAKDIESCDVQCNAQNYKSEHMPTLMTPAGDCTTHEMAAELLDTLGAITDSNNEIEKIKESQENKETKTIEETNENNPTVTVDKLDPLVGELSGQKSEPKHAEVCEVVLESSPDLFESSSPSSSSDVSDSSLHDKVSYQSQELKECDRKDNSVTMDATNDIKTTLNDKDIENTVSDIKEEHILKVFGQNLDVKDTNDPSDIETFTKVEKSLESKTVTKDLQSDEDDIDEAKNMENLPITISYCQTSEKNIQDIRLHTSGEKEDINEGSINKFFSEKASNKSVNDFLMEEKVSDGELTDNSQLEERSCKRSKSPGNNICSGKKIKLDNEHGSDETKAKKRTASLCDEDMHSIQNSSKHPKLLMDESFAQGYATNRYCPKELKHLAAKVVSSLEEETEWESSIEKNDIDSFNSTHHKSQNQYPTLKVEKDSKQNIESTSNLEVNDNYQQMETVNETNEISTEDTSIKKGEEEKVETTTTKPEDSCREQTKVYPFKFSAIKNDKSSKLDNQNDQEINIKNKTEFVESDEQSTVDIHSDTDTNIAIDLVPQNNDDERAEIDETTDIKNGHSDGEPEKSNFITAMEYLSQSSQGSSTGFLVDPSKCTELRSSSQESSQPSQEKHIEVSISENAEVPNVDADDLPEQATLSNTAGTKEVHEAMDTTIDTDVLDSYVSRAIDDLVPDHDEGSTDEDKSDNCSLYQPDEGIKDKKFYSCDVDMYDDSDKLVCSPVDKPNNPEPSSSSTGCFRWKYAPSFHSDKPLSELEDEDKMVTITPIQTCNKPIRLGLSKRNKPLHKLHKF